MAYIAYAKGFCDTELIQITNENSMFKHQARYLVKRRQLELWAVVLNEENIHKRQLVDQVGLFFYDFDFRADELVLGCSYCCTRID